jgi:hypothetical protein
LSTFPRHRWRRFGWQGTVVAAAVSLALVLAQHTAGATFTAQTADGGDTVSSAASFCPGVGTTTLNPDSDTTGYQSTPTTFYGTDTRLGALSGNGADGRALLHFDLTGAIPAFCSLTGATLNLYANSPASGRTIEVHLVTVGSSWSEAATNWTNMPTYGATPVATSASLSLAGWQAWPVTALVGALLSGTNDGFLVKDQTEGVSPPHNNIYDSREGPNKPRLVITYG